MIDIPPVSKALSELNIPHNVFVHPGPLQSLAQAAEERGQRPDQIVLSILFRGKKRQYIMVLIAGPGQIDWKVLRQYLGTNRLTMATEEQVLKVTGYQLRTVAPFGIPQPIKILVDISVLREEIISLGSGVRVKAIIMKSSDLIRALGEYEVGDLRKK